MTGAPERWVFGYGSLMWRPGFDYLERRGAQLQGRRRAFCIYSVHHRGTPARPGLVLGLAQGGAVRLSASEKPVLPPSLVTALYRAFMSPAAAANPRGITVPLILEVVKEQKDWNEDRT